MEARDELGGDLAPATAEPARVRARLPDLVLGAAVLAVFTALGAASAHLQSLIPGSVAGLLLLTIALGVLEGRGGLHRVVTRGLVPLARVLLGHMGLLFVPAGVVGVQGLLALPARDVMPVLLALVLSTLLGLAATALVMSRSR